MTTFQELKIAELIRLNWTQQGKRFHSSCRRHDIQHVYMLEAATGLVRAFVYPASVEYITHHDF